MAGMGRIAALVAFLFAGAAQAADETTYLYGAVGATRIDPAFDQAANDASLQALGAPDVSSKVDRWDSGWKVMVGWMPSRYLALEGGFTAIGTATYMAQFTGGAAKSEFRAGGIVFDVLGLLPVSDSQCVFGKVGGIAASKVVKKSVTPPGDAKSASTNNA